jgi:uncharacterized membrane protein YeiB
MQSIFSDDLILWATLMLLIVLFLLVGQKTAAADVKLLENAGYKRPMFAFEMNSGEASKMFQSWNDETKGKLRAALLWDFLFIFIYPAAIAAACFIAARFLDAREIIPLKYGLIVMLLQLVAAALDAVENFALLKVLNDETNKLLPTIAKWCAVTKFSFIVIGLFYAIIIGGGTWLILLVKNLFVAKTA